MSKTYAAKGGEIEREWHLFDAEGRVLGRLASRIAPLLMGKNKPHYSPNLDMGDHVVVVNAGKFKVTGRKEKKKIYYRHSGHPGGLKEETLGHLRKRLPLEPLKRAVRGMLPKNRLLDKRMSRLHLFEGEDHPFKNKFKK